jgi:hypothetical protein
MRRWTDIAWLEHKTAAYQDEDKREEGREHDREETCK